MPRNVHEALFTTANTWRQPKCASAVKGWRRCGVYTYLHSEILLSHKKSEIMPFVAIQMDLKISN